MLGGLAWVITLAIVHPAPTDAAWAKALLMLAPLVLVPLSLRLVCATNGTDETSRLWQIVAGAQLPAALSLGGSFLLPQGVLAALMSAPWLATTGHIALLGLARVRRVRRGPMHELCVAVGMIYLAIGAAWATLDRAGIRPLDFDPIIVLLTAIHFHYAGFVLPILAGLAMRELNGRTAVVAGFGAILAVPLVAVGITTTQLGIGPTLEFVSAWFMALAGVLTGSLYVRVALDLRQTRLVRVLWIIAGVSLIGSMGLAALYGSRFLISLPWLDIEWMRAVHGTANTFGFAFVGLIGWQMAGAK